MRYTLVSIYNYEKKADLVKREILEHRPSPFKDLIELLKYIEMETQEILKLIQKTESPLKRQLLMVALLTRLLR